MLHLSLPHSLINISIEICVFEHTPVFIIFFYPNHLFVIFWKTKAIVWVCFNLDCSIFCQQKLLIFISEIVMNSWQIVHESCKMCILLFIVETVKSVLNSINASDEIPIVNEDLDCFYLENQLPSTLFVVNKHTFNVIIISELE